MDQQARLLLADIYDSAYKQYQEDQKQEVNQSLNSKHSSQAQLYNDEKSFANQFNNSNVVNDNDPHQKKMYKSLYGIKQGDAWFAGKPNEKFDPNTMPIMQCSIHGNQISKVCMRDDCYERMFMCIDCAQDFPEHFGRHRPFFSYEEFYQTMKTSAHFKRKSRISSIDEDIKNKINEIDLLMQQELSRITTTVIPELQKRFARLCDKLQDSIEDEIKEFFIKFKKDSIFLVEYLQKKDYVLDLVNNIPDFSIIQNVLREGETNPRKAEVFLENLYKKLFTEQSIEITNQAFSYFDQMYQNFFDRNYNIPRFNAENQLWNSIEDSYTSFTKSSINKFDNYIPLFPMCAGCNLQLNNNQHVLETEHAITIQELQNSLQQLNSLRDSQIRESKIFLRDGDIIFKDVVRDSSILSSPVFQNKINGQNININQIFNQNQSYFGSQNNNIFSQNTNFQSNSNQLGSSKSNKKFLDPILTPNNKLNGSGGSALGSMYQDAGKQRPTKPAQCKGCRLLYCVRCQNGNCVRCQFSFDEVFNEKVVYNSQFIIVDQGLKAVLNDADPKISSKQSRAQIVISQQTFYVGKFQFDITVENNDACLTLGFGIAKRKDIIRAIMEDYDLRDIKNNNFISILQANGNTTGGLRGNVTKFVKDRFSTFRAILDFNRMKFIVYGKGVSVQKNLQENVGYTVIAYSAGSFRSYNSVKIQTYDLFEPLAI